MKVKRKKYFKKEGIINCVKLCSLDLNEDYKGTTEFSLKR